MSEEETFTHWQAIKWIAGQTGVALIAYIIVLGVLFGKLFDKTATPIDFLWFWIGWMIPAVFFLWLRNKKTA